MSDITADADPTLPLVAFNTATGEQLPAGTPVDTRERCPGCGELWSVVPVGHAFTFADGEWQCHTVELARPAAAPRYPDPIPREDQDADARRPAGPGAEVPATDVRAAREIGDDD